MGIVEYKIREKRIVKDARVKYFIFCEILDLLVYEKYFSNKAVSLNNIDDYLDKRSIYEYDWNVPAVRIKLWLEEMVVLNLIDMGDDGNISLTKEGYKACQDQRFHSIRASLYEAKFNRQLSICSCVIAIIALVVSIISYLS